MSLAGLRRGTYVQTPLRSSPGTSPVGQQPPLWQTLAHEWHEMPNNAWRRPCEKSTNFSGWWLTYPSEKWWNSSVGMIIPNIWKNKIPWFQSPPTRIFANILIKCESDFLRCQRTCSGLAVSENRCVNSSWCFLHEAKSSWLQRSRLEPNGDGATDFCAQESQREKGYPS